MTNQEMQTQNRAIRKWLWMRDCWRHGADVITCTYGKATYYSAKHADLFRVRKSGLYVQRGKSWDCLNFTNLKSYSY